MTARFVERWPCSALACSRRAAGHAVRMSDGTSVPGSQVYSKLAGKPFDPALLKVRVQVAKMRRTLGYFIEHKFEPKAVTDKLKEYGFKPASHSKIVVTWDWRPEAKAAADAAGIKLWDFREIMREIRRIYFRGNRAFSQTRLGAR